MRVRIERSYLDRFTVQAVQPAITSVTADAYVVDLGDVEPGASRSVQLELEGGSVGRSAGSVAVSAPDQELRLEMRTFTFP